MIFNFDLKERGLTLRQRSVLILLTPLPLLLYVWAGYFYLPRNTENTVLSLFVCISLFSLQVLFYYWLQKYVPDRTVQKITLKSEKGEMERVVFETVFFAGNSLVTPRLYVQGKRVPVEPQWDRIRKCWKYPLLALDENLNVVLVEAEDETGSQIFLDPNKKEDR